MLPTFRRPTMIAVAAALAVTAVITAIHARQAAESAKALGNAQAAASAQVLATVNGAQIRQSDVTTLSPAVTADQVLGILVDFRLLDQAAVQHRIVISEGELQHRRADMIASEGVKSYADAAKAVKRTPVGMDMQLRHAAILEKLASAELPAPPKDMLHVRGLLIRPGGPHAATSAAAHLVALKLQGQINDGRSVGGLAKRYSDDPLSKSHNGDMGIIQNVLPSPPSFGPDNRAFQALLTAIPQGRVDGPIRGDRGYWVVQISSSARRPGTDGAKYAAVQSAWSGYWLQKLEPGVMGRLRGKAAVDPPLLETRRR